MPKRDRPNRIKRVERHEKHQQMRKEAKKQKRANMAQFKTQLMGVKHPKDHPLNNLEPEQEDDGSTPKDFKQLLRERSKTRRARADRWRNGRKSRGTVKLYGYELDPHAIQVKLAVATSRQAFTFEEPKLPYWMIPDEDDIPDEKPTPSSTSSKATSSTSSTSSTTSTAVENPEETATETAPEILLERLKMVHGDIILTTPWEICLYVDCLLQAGSKLLKNRHTTANRGAPPFFPVTSEHRQQCLSLLRSLHTSLVVPFWNLIEKKGDAEAECTKINQAAIQISNCLMLSKSRHCFDLRRPGIIEKWSAPLFHRLQVLNLWSTESNDFKNWIQSVDQKRYDGVVDVINEEEETQKKAAIEIYHSETSTGNRPDWVDATTTEAVWQ